MEELTRFIEENQKPLSEILSAMELPPEMSEREVTYLKKWREELKMEWPLIKEAFLRGKISGKWEKYGFVYVDMTMYQWYGDAIHSLDDLRLFEERERERLKKITSEQRKPVKIADRTRPSHDPYFSRSDVVNLKPCPFCGCEDVVIKNQFSSKYDSFYTVAECSRCKASTRPSENFTNGDPSTEEFWKSESVLEVSKLWNSRV